MEELREKETTTSRRVHSWHFQYYKFGYECELPGDFRKVRSENPIALGLRAWFQPRRVGGGWLRLRRCGHRHRFHDELGADLGGGAGLYAGVVLSGAG